jgi:hypothetical protein
MKPKIKCEQCRRDAIDGILVWPFLAAQPCAIGDVIPTPSLACCTLALAFHER